MHACSAGPEGRLACEEPSFTPTEHNHTCGELEHNSAIQKVLNKIFLLAACQHDDLHQSFNNLQPIFLFAHQLTVCMRTCDPLLKISREVESGPSYIVWECLYPLTYLCLYPLRHFITKARPRQAYTTRRSCRSGDACLPAVRRTSWAYTCMYYMYVQYSYMCCHTCRVGAEGIGGVRDLG